MIKDDDIYLLYCQEHMGYIPHISHKIHIEKTYHFMLYHLNFRLKEFVQEIIKPFKIIVDKFSKY